MINSGFPRLFLKHSPPDHFCVTPICRFSPAPSSTSFCFVPRFSFCLSSFLLMTAFWNSICVLSFLLSSFLSQRSSASPHSPGSQRKSPRISSINIVKDAMQARLQSGHWKSQTIRVGCELDLTTVSQRASCMYNATFIRVTFALTGYCWQKSLSHKKKRCLTSHLLESFEEQDSCFCQESPLRTDFQPFLHILPLVICKLLYPTLLSLF